MTHNAIRATSGFLAAAPFDPALPASLENINRSPL
jgi:hypothetical protein